MDHRAIEEQGIAETYVLGRLAPADEAAFEEHLLTCGECRDRVTWSEELRGSLGELAAEEGVRAARLGLLARLAWFARGGRPGRPGLVAGSLFVLALVLLSALIVEEARWRRRLATVQAAAVRPAASAVATPRRGARPGPSPGTLPGISPGTSPGTPLEAPRPGAAGQAAAAEEARLAARLSRQDEELRRANSTVDGLRARLAEIGGPQVNTIVASLGPVRGQEAPPSRIVLGPRPAWVVLSIELPAPGAGAWQATLVDAGGRTVWSGGGLRPAANDTLNLGLPSGLAAPGAYLLLLDRPGDPPAHAEIAFQVVQPPR